MKLKVARTHLVKALSHVQGVVERRANVPILSNVLLDTELPSGATSRSLRLRATDLEMEMAETVTAEITQPGKVTVPAHLLYEIIRKFPEGIDIELDTATEKDVLIIIGGRARFSLRTLPATDFPSFESGDTPWRFHLPAPDLKWILDRSRCAMSCEAMRHYLNGIYLHRHDDGATPTLRAVATDGHRLALVSVDAPEESHSMPGIIIPRKTVNELIKILDGQDHPVEIAISSTEITFSLPHMSLHSRLVNGQFPDYAAVIPQENPITFSLDKEAFAEVVDRIATISSDRGKAVKLQLDTHLLLLSVNNLESGEAKEGIEVQYEGEPITIGFNARYLLDVAANVDHDTLHIGLSSPNSPAVLYGAGNRSSLYIVMPMRV